MEISVTIALTLHFILWIFCLQQQIEIDEKYPLIGPMNNFFKLKMKSLYQCMEICLQFTACTGLSYRFNICYLHNDDYYAMVDKCWCGPWHWEKSDFPDHISGACLNHNCSMDTRCLAIPGTGNHVCVPHDLALFSCPWYWLRYDKSCYRPFFVNVTWQSAYDQCRMENASLIEILDSDTQKYLNLMLSHFSHPVNPSRAGYMSGGQLYWTALTDEKTDGEWVWRGSGKVLANFTHWTENATVWKKLVPGNDCVGMSTPDSFRWKPVKCDSLFFYVCEKLMVQ